MLFKFSLKTTRNNELIDITDEVEKYVRQTKISSGLCVVYTPHTTAAITINENADPTVQRDIIYELNKIVPLSDNYQHSEGNSAAHIKSSLVGTSETIIIENNQLLLGTWQGIYFCEFDGPRARTVFVKCL
ncbi:MAG TPA: secondary thiamine-phosphate synthase enzyme YjbQ [bacterium]|nr:secondary thiamine-phosphate synthase enzyme YjbQ [bacterium]HPP87692.1 secondary thiamine-phosphate synthase enzyme YjbQ [bacterium]